MAKLQLPAEVEGTFKEFYTCEFTTINSKGQPLTWPTEPFYLEAEGKLVVTSSIAFPIKAHNARRTPKVSLLFSDPTGSKTEGLPAVLVQGDAVEVRELVDDPPWTYEMFKESIVRQPNTRNFVANPIVQRLFTFQFQRLAIFVQPRRIVVWPARDFDKAPTEVEVSYVG